MKEGFYKQMLSFKNLIETEKLAWPAVSLKDSMRTMKTIEEFILK